MHAHFCTYLNHICVNACSEFLVATSPCWMWYRRVYAATLQAGIMDSQLMERRDILWAAFQENSLDTQWQGCVTFRPILLVHAIHLHVTNHVYSTYHVCADHECWHVWLKDISILGMFALLLGVWHAHIRRQQHLKFRYTAGHIFTLLESSLTTVHHTLALFRPGLWSKQRWLDLQGVGNQLLGIFRRSLLCVEVLET